MTQQQYVLHLHWNFHVTLRWMIRNKSVRHLSCNAQGMINIRWHFFQIKLFKQHFLLLSCGTKGIHVWFVKGCMRWAMLASGLNCPCEPFSLLLGSMALPGPGDCPETAHVLLLVRSQNLQFQRVKSSAPTSSHRQGKRTWPVERGACTRSWRSSPGEEVGLWKAQSPRWLPAAPLPSGLCSPGGNLRQMKNTALPKCTPC